MSEKWLWFWVFLPNLDENRFNIWFKSMVEGPTIMLGVFITFLWTYTIPIYYYCSISIMLGSWWPNIAHTEAEIKILGMKSANIWVWKWDGWVNEYIVVVHHLLYTHKIPIKHYISTNMLISPLAERVGRGNCGVLDIIEARYLAICGCKVTWMTLQCVVGVHNLTAMHMDEFDSFLYP